MPSPRTTPGLAFASLVALPVLAILGLVLPSGAAPDTRLLVAFTELRGSSSLLWAADPDAPSHRRSLGSITHREGYGPRAAPSPDGRLLALSFLPPDGKDGDYDGQLLLLDLGTGQARPALEGISARSTPLWTPDGRLLAVKRLRSHGPELVTLAVATAAVTATERETDALDLFPVGWAPDGSMLYVAVQTPQGFELKATALPGSLRFIASLGVGPARDFRLAPDGKALSYLATGPAKSRGDLAAVVLPLSDTDEDQSPGQWLVAAGAPALGAAWEPQSTSLTVALIRSASGGTALYSYALAGAAPHRALPPSHGGYDVPLSWSPDGAYLAVRHLAGPDLEHLSAETLDILTRDGRRATVGAPGSVSFAGWLPATVAKP